MTLVVALFGAVVVALGLSGIASPTRLLDLVTRVQTRIGLYAIAALRLFLGAAFLAAAPESRAPLYLQAVGVIALVSGLATPFFGVRRFEAIVAWFRRWPDAGVRAWSLLVVAFGASLVWAVLPVSGGA